MKKGIKEKIMLIFLITLIFEQVETCLSGAEDFHNASEEQESDGKCGIPGVKQNNDPVE